MGLLFPISFDWSLPVSFDSNHSNHRVVSIPLRIQKNDTSLSRPLSTFKYLNFSLSLGILLLRPYLSIFFKWTRTQLWNWLAFLFRFSLTSSSPIILPLSKAFPAPLWKLKDLRQEQSKKYYLACNRRTSVFRELIFAHIWEKRDRDFFVLFKKNFSLDLPENNLKGELLW